MSNTILLFWVFPSLITFLLMLLSMGRHYFDKSIEAYAKEDLIAASVLSILYPIGLSYLFQTHVWPWIIKAIKERSLTNKD